MAQSLEVNIKTTSDVPQAMEKAKSATVSFSKQVEDIQKKFSTAFKDIFLGFTAPMVLLQAAISFISSAIEKAKQDAREGLDLIAKGETAYANSEEQKLAQFIKTKKATEEEQAQVRAGKREMTKEFLTTPEGMKLLEERKQAEDELYGGRGGRRTRYTGVKAYDDPSDPALQAAALRAFLNSEEGKKYKPIFEDKSGKAGTFKTPEGFGNVVGVGANPVMEAMTMQLEESRKQTALLESINQSSNGGGVPTDFTKGQTTKTPAFSGR